jgi:hypothetical protein
MRESLSREIVNEACGCAGTIFTTCGVVAAKFVAPALSWISFGLVVLIGVAQTTPAAAATFGFSSTCQFDCGNVGLSTGDTVLGEIDFFDLSISPGATLTEADISSFWFDFGNVEIDSSTAVGVRFNGSLSADASSLSVVAFVASEAIDPALDPNSGITGDLIIFPIGNAFGNDPSSLFDWQATTAGACASTACISALWHDISVGPEIDAFSPLPSAAIPEPGAFALYVIGLASFGITRRLRIF